MASAATADGVFKASQSSGRMVDERQLKQFVAYGSSATNQQTLRTIFGGLEPIIGEIEAWSQTWIALDKPATVIELVAHTDLDDHACDSAAAV